MSLNSQKLPFSFRDTIKYDITFIFKKTISDKSDLVTFISDKELIEYLVKINNADQKIQSSDFYFYLCKLLNDRCKYKRLKPLVDKNNTDEISCFLQGEKTMCSRIILKNFAKFFNIEIKLFFIDSNEIWEETTEIHSDIIFNIIVFENCYYIEKKKRNNNNGNQIQKIIQNILFYIEKGINISSYFNINSVDITTIESLNQTKNINRGNSTEKSISKKPEINDQKKIRNINFKRIKDLEHRKLKYNEFKVHYTPCLQKNLTLQSTISYGSVMSVYHTKKDEDQRYDHSKIKTIKNSNKNKTSKLNTYFKKEDTVDDKGCITNDCNFTEALKFISYYQTQIKNKPPTYNNKKGYKPLVIGKSDTFLNGKVKFYKNNDKYGFIQLADLSEVFLHKDNLMRARIDSLAFENCTKYFDILVKFRILHYQGKNKCNAKAIDIEILNFVPKTQFH